MKKLMMLLAFCGLTTFAMAETTTESYPTLKHRVVTNGFWDNWFIDLGATHLSFFSSQEHGSEYHKKNPFWPGRRSWGAELSVGKWATPVFGMRAKVQGGWGTQVNFQSWDDPYVKGGNPTFHQINFGLQPMINLTNLFAGYKPRVWNIILYGGAGAMVNLGRTADEYDDATYWSPLLTVGVLNTFNITKRLHLNLDVYGNMGDTNLDGNTKQKSKPRVFGTRDLQLGISAGLGVNLGKVGWDNAPDMDAILANHKAQLDALNASLAGLEAENAALKNKLANQKPAKEVVKTISEFKSTSASVFFNLNKWDIASKKDLIDVQELAQYAKDNGKKVVVTGYADSKTGNASWNQTLSERRADTVKKAIMDMGVKEEDIEVSGQGGVDIVSPYPYNRRVTVSLK
ncbi:MAG: OmpA family protein [Bacteroidaceae bacterium]|nr:OmpA family protein [Bacteroidaceae bacterium]